MTTAAEWAAAAERQPDVPAGAGERYAGYGIMGLPFASGHVLAMRRFPAASVGPGYTSVWHRDPTGRWQFWQDQPASMGCARYFSAALAETLDVRIEVAWPAPDTIRLAVPDLEFRWTATLRSSGVTRVLSAVGASLPERVWRAQPVLSLMGPMAGALMGAGRVGLAGVAPNGQRFIANPVRVWLVAESTASLRGVDFGPPGPLDRQAALGDFLIPQRGVFAVGRAYFTG